MWGDRSERYPVGASSRSPSTRRVPWAQPPPPGPVGPACLSRRLGNGSYQATAKGAGAQPRSLDSSPTHGCPALGGQGTGSFWCDPVWGRGCCHLGPCPCDGPPSGSLSLARHLSFSPLVLPPIYFLCCLSCRRRVVLSSVGLPQGLRLSLLVSGSLSHRLLPHFRPLSGAGSPPSPPAHIPASTPARLPFPGASCCWREWARDGSEVGVPAGAVGGTPSSGMWAGLPAGRAGGAVRALDSWLRADRLRLPPQTLRTAHLPHTPPPQPAPLAHALKKCTLQQLGARYGFPPECQAPGSAVHRPAPTHTLPHSHFDATTKSLDAMIFKTMPPPFSPWTKTSLKKTAELKVTPGRAGTQSLRDLSPTTAPSQNTAHCSSHTLRPTIPSVAIGLPEKQRAAYLGWGQVGCVPSLTPSLVGPGRRGMSIRPFPVCLRQKKGQRTPSASWGALVPIQPH
ncbi:cold-inducible RNA-binding protein isoform X1 [Enhydra lutris kenyoni]|uniref:Cold-inducible RNA-binding protein isoform X1 n=1 Tax=Enhydra lutris kenyoni TaxID=391180 RepID=A0A2Y9L6M1_ENHLU|nr:cold-inducible RNA-binding protein isoform X1 [Enhydra lutris kenyoni]